MDMDMDAFDEFFANYKPEKSDRDHPLFMDKLPDNMEDHPELAALLHIDDEGTTEESAENNKDRGNKLFQKGGEDNYNKAIMEYTLAINKRGNDLKANSIYYCNRAACNLELGNYGRVVMDCHEAVKLNENNVKAYWRAAKAAFKLWKLPESLKFCMKGLEIEPDNKTLLKEKTIIENAIDNEKI